MTSTYVGLKGMAAWSTGVFVVGVAATALFDHPVFLSLAVGIAGLITFFGSLQGDDAGEDKIRRAITLTIVVVYALLVATVMFFDIEGTGPALLYVTMTTSIVVVFYFASSVYLESQLANGSGASAPTPTAPRSAAPARRRTTAK